jgi:hypothetical protein
MSLLQRQDWLVLSFWRQHVSKLFSADLCISVTRDSGLHSSWRLEHRNTHKFGQGAARTSSSVGEITFFTWFLYSHIILHIISYCILKSLWATFRFHHASAGTLYSAWMPLGMSANFRSGTVTATDVRVAPNTPGTRVVNYGKLW